MTGVLDVMTLGRSSPFEYWFPDSISLRGLSQLRDQARELASQDARELVERFGQMGRRKLELAG